MSDSRDKNGRFAPGNTVGRKRKRKTSGPTTLQLVRKVDRAFAGIGQEKTADQLASILVGLIGKARDGDTTAATWILDRLVPRERLRLSVDLPTPTANPLLYLDRLSEAVADGELTVDQAAKLANLARPLLADAELVALREQVTELIATVDRLERTRLHAADA